MSAIFPNINGFQIVSQIGGGGFSTVYRAMNEEENRIAACKHIKLTLQTTPKQRKEAEKEMRIHSQLRHAHILEFYDGAVLEPQQAVKYIPGFYMMLEFAAGGDLFDKIAPDVGVEDEVAHLYFNQLVSGLNYIHGEGVCHRDLKPENILLDVVGTLKICDFGLSAVYKLKQTGQTRSLSEQCGSFPYSAPEMNSRSPYSGEAIDVWGMGVILYTLLAGNTPWDIASNESPEFQMYLKGTIFREDPWNRFSSSALSLLRGLLNVDPQRRLAITDIMQHPWCIRPSQLARQSPAMLAEKLTQSIRKNGDMAYAAPVLPETLDEVDGNGDSIMQSQFTQTLLLFSQTQSGKKYTPQLTRFYAKLGPSLLFNLIHEALTGLSIECKVPNDPPGVFRLRIGGHDRRKVIYKGWVEVQHFHFERYEGSFVVMSRDVGNPISWRELWRALISSDLVEPHVYRRN